MIFQLRKETRMRIEEEMKLYYHTADKQLLLTKMRLSITGLQYFHAELNRLFFSNELKPVTVIKVPPVKSEYEGLRISAFFEDRTDPYIIGFYDDPAEMPPLQAVRILLHEMIHQYRTEKFPEEEDLIRNTPNHNDAFKKQELAHGINGETLTEAAEEIVTERLLKYFSANASAPFMGDMED